jgi:uncharacterized membrane protein (UPF0127 family)
MAYLSTRGKISIEGVVIMIRSLMVAVALAAFQSAICVAAELPTTTLTIGEQKVVAEVAVTPEQRALGLMNRFSLKPDHGMLFVFERPEPQAFWMKNTFIPLSIAFIGADGRIVNIEDMAPQTEDSHWSKGPAMYALEMRKGWFRDKGIGPGALVKGGPLKES